MLIFRIDFISTGNKFLLKSETIKIKPSIIPN